jgi:hypothetical protein
VALPKFVQRYIAHSAAVRRAAMAANHSRSWGMTMPDPKTSTRPSGKGVSTSQRSLPYNWPRYDWTITNTPSVATVRASAEARRRICITTTCVKTPIATASSTPAANAARNGQLRCSCSSRHVRKADALAMAPCAKLTTPDPR